MVTPVPLPVRERRRICGSPSFSRLTRSSLSAPEWPYIYIHDGCILEGFPSARVYPGTISKQRRDSTTTLYSTWHVHYNIFNLYTRYEYSYNTSSTYCTYVQKLKKVSLKYGGVHWIIHSTQAIVVCTIYLQVHLPTVQVGGTSIILYTYCVVVLYGHTCIYTTSITVRVRTVLFIY